MTAANQQLQQAVALLQSGNVDAAISQLSALGARAPNADTFNWLAIAYVRARKFNEALIAIQRAIEISPGSAGLYLTAANIQQDLLNLPAAIELLRQSITVNPAFAEGHNNLGIILTDLGRIDEAIPAFREAVRLKPGYARAYANLAAAQLRSMQFADALTSATRAVELQPDYAHAHHLKGNALVVNGHAAAAEVELKTALRLKPDFAESSLLLARTLIKLKRSEEAAQIAQQALAFSPTRHDLWTTLGDIAAEHDDMASALAAYQRALALQPHDVLPMSRAALLLPHVYSSESHLEACRARLAQGIEHLHAEVDNLAAALQAPRFGDSLANNFLLAYQGRNDRDLQRSYANFVARMAEKVLAGEMPALTNAKAPKDRRIRLGFCSRFFYVSTAGNYFASWITDLDRDVFEIFIYHTHVIDDALTRRLRAAADHFVQAEESFTFFREQIRADALDILVYPEIGMDRVVFLLAALRLAPIQVSGWGHPMTPGHPALDYYLSCEAMEPPDAQAHYNEHLLLLPGIGTRYDRPRVSAEAAAKARADYQLPATAKIYFSPQSLFKIHPANDRLMVRAIAANPDSVLVMFAGHNPQSTQKFVARLSAAFAAEGVSSQGRVKILPGLSHDDYKRVNQLSDVMLDTLHWSGGNTSLDALAMGLPIVTLPGEFMRGRQTMAMLRLLGVEELIAKSEDDYLAIVHRLGTDSEYRAQISQRILANLDRVFDDAAPTQALGRVLEQLVRGGLPALSAI